MIGFFDLAVYYLSRLVIANFQIAWEIVTPGLKTSPGFLEVPLKIQSRTGILLFSNLLSMTPGTLTVTVDPEKNTLRVHALYCEDMEKLNREVEAIQEKIRRLTE